MLGDLYDPSASSQEVLARMRTLLDAAHPGIATILSNRISVGAWRITAAILRSDRDLADPDAAGATKAAITSSLFRFGYVADDPLRDHRERLFDLTVSIHEDYWSRRQVERSDGFRVIGFGRLLARVPVGTSIKRVDTGRSFEVVVAGSKAIDARSGIDRLRIAVPRREALSIRGDLFRIARGSERNPDAHDLYRIL